MKLLALGLLLATLAVPADTTLAGGARRDLSTGRIRILYIGDAWGPTP